MLIQLKDTPQLNEQQIEHLKTVLGIIANKMKYPAAYNFAREDEFEQDFLEFRKVRSTHTYRQKGCFRKACD